MSYRDELRSAMRLLGEHPRTRFLGQTVLYPGTAMFETFADVPESKRIELPVAEELQMGMTIGLMLAGFIPISVFPRWNFLLLAMNQLVNHLDKIHQMTQDRSSKAIIRTAIGSTSPLHPGPQHTGDFSQTVKSMCPSINVLVLETPDCIVPTYLRALDNSNSSLIVEIADSYGAE